MTPVIFQRRPQIAVAGPAAAVVSNEPIFLPGTDTVVFADTFDTYTDIASAQAHGWATASSGTQFQFTAPGLNGSAKKMQINWTLGDGGIGMDTSFAAGAQGRVCICTYYYKTSTPWSIDSLGKKHFIINLGDADRITVGMTDNSHGQHDLLISGLFVDQDILHDPDFTPFAPLTCAQHMTDGTEHRVTIRRTQSSSGTSGGGGTATADGSVEIWVDGFQVHDLTGIKLGAIPITKCEFANTWNNGAAATETEMYDDLRIWY